MSVKIEFDNETAAFHGATAHETARILTEIACKIRDGVKDHGHVLDANGNTVGTWEYTVTACSCGMADYGEPGHDGSSDPHEDEED